MASPLKSLSAQLMLGGMLLSLLPLLLFAWFTHSSFEQELLRKQEQQLYLIARDKARLVRERLDFVSAQLEVAATLPATIRTLVAKNSQEQEIALQLLSEFGDRFLALTGHYDLLLISTERLVVYSAKRESDLNADLSQLSWQPSLLARADEQCRVLLATHVSMRRHYEPSNSDAIFMATPVWGNDGHLLGVMALQLKADWLADLSKSQVGLNQTGELVLSQPNEMGRLVALAPLRLDPMAYKNKRLLDLEREIPAVRAARGEEGWGQGLDYRGQQVLAGWAAVPMIGAGVVAKQDLTEVLAPLEAQRHVLIVVTLAVILAMMVALVVLVNFYVAPIRRVVEKVDQLAKGQWWQRMEVGDISSHEIGALTQGVNHLAATIEGQIDALQHQAAEMEEQSQSLANYSRDLEEEVKERTQELERLTMIDPLTGLFNRRRYNQVIETMLNESLERGIHLAFVMIDIDHFKEFNDSLGHLAGDDSLIKVAKVLKNEEKVSDFAVFRMGGEEFALLMLVDDKQQAIQVADKVRLGVEALSIRHPKSRTASVLTISMGLAFWDGSGCTSPRPDASNRLYSLADKALYEAKTRGRHRMAIAQTELGC